MMETMTTEFIDPDFVVVKEEVKYDKAESKGNSGARSNRTKCGEIFTTRSREFLLICSYCENIYYSMITFGLHVLDKHQDLPDFDKTVKVENQEKTTLEITTAFEYIEQIDCPVLEDLKTEDSQPTNFASNNSESNETLFDNLETIEDDWKNSSDNLTDDFSWEETDEQASQDPSKKLMLNTTALDSESPVDCPSSDLPKKKKRIRKKYISKSNPLRSGAKKVNPDSVQNPDLFCEHCSREYANRSYFRRHAMQHENLPAAIKRDPDWLKCIYCSVESETREAWVEHERTHAGKCIKARYQCSFCPKKCQTVAGAEEHMNIHRGLKPFKCDQCAVGFASKMNLQHHVRRIHLGERSHCCELCGRRFYSANEKKEHILRAHTHEKPIQCEVCGKKFLKNATLNFHMKTHLTKDVKCQHCDKTFFHKKHLSLHMAKHSTARPYVCRTCGNAFSRRNSLKAHVLLHAEVKKYVCKICNRGFAQAAGLYSHMKSHAVAS